jgi:signal transduction histidine kinase
LLIAESWSLTLFPQGGSDVFELPDVFESPGSSEGVRLFAATLAHEVRAPLSSLRLCVEGLACKGMSALDRRRVELALGQIDHLEDLAAEVGSFSTHRPSVAGWTDAGGVVREVAKEMETTAVEGGVRVCVRCEEGLPRVDAGRGQVRRILFNLCCNGLQAMSRGGALRMWARRAPPGGVEVGVQDTGCGIPASDLGRVWEPFFTTKPEGLGIGLAVVKSLVEGQGGRVRMESGSGRGTTVRVWFRACAQEGCDAPGAGD